MSATIYERKDTDCELSTPDLTGNESYTLILIQSKKMKTKKLQLDIYRLFALVKLLPNPLTFGKDKFVIAISDTDSFSSVTFLKVDNKWKLLMDSVVEKTQKLSGREFNAIWIDEVVNQNGYQLSQLCQRVRPIN